MAFLQRRPQVSNPVNYITVGLNKTVLLVGLGNPGPEYQSTRHNVGFLCLDAFVRANNMSGWIEKKDLKCAFSSDQLGETRVIAIKPLSFMNNSGEAVQAVLNFYKIPLEQMVVVYDELAVDFGNIRTRVGGESAGHNGIKSVITHVGSEQFGRVRIGIGPKKPEQMDTADFVLQKFSTQEHEYLPALTREASAILSEFVFSGQLPHETRNFII